MRDKAILCLFILCLLVGVASADTLIAYTNTNSDGGLRRITTNEAWLTMIGGAGTVIANTSSTSFTGIRIDTGSSSNKYDDDYRFGISFNTSEIPDDAIIDSVIVSFVSVAGGYKNWKGDAFSITLMNFNPDDPEVLAASDYNKKGTYTGTANITYASWNAGGRQNYTLPSSWFSTLDKTGYTSLMLVHIQDAFSTTPIWASSVADGVLMYESSNADIANRPFIEVTWHEPADTTPPASITNLANTTTCNSINWTWTNPADADFNHTMIYQNGTFLKNVTNTTSFDLWEGLAENLEYTLSSHTCDITGNCNTTWVNKSSMTTSCTTPTPTPTPVTLQADFSSNVTCGNVPFAVQFNDTSTGNPETWNWSFGQGNFSNETNPVFTYLNAGMYSINLTINQSVNFSYRNHSAYIRGVPDWYSCPVIVTPTPWQPEIMPSTEFDVRGDNLLTRWWWVGAGALGLIFLFGRK